MSSRAFEELQCALETQTEALKTMHEATRERTQTLVAQIMGIACLHGDSCFQQRVDLAKTMSKASCDWMSLLEQFGYRKRRDGTTLYYKNELDVHPRSYPDIDLPSLDIASLPADVFNFLYLYAHYFPKHARIQKAKATRDANLAKRQRTDDW